ncbi:MAG: HEAT repeat domain-containing protein [Gemmatimonadales bacterium]|jgi:HEAT repeat protein/beta-lactamase regulating signal transducer with metallopeptidase domain
MSTTLLLDAAIKCTLYLALLFLVSSALRQKPAAVRHLLWSLGLIGALLLPALSAGLPWHIGILPAGDPVAIPVGDAKLVAPKQEKPVEPLPAAKWRDGGQPAATDAAAPAAKASAAKADSAQPKHEERDAIGIGLPDLPRLPAPLAVAWVLGMLVVFGRLAVGMTAMRSIIRRGRRLDAPHWRELAGLARRRLDIDGPVRLFASRRVPTPFVFGLTSPVVVLPEAAERWSDDRRLTVLLHELAHYRRGDAFSHLVSQIACAVYWFNPLVWLAARRLRCESERACDDLVLRSGTRASDYVHHLLDIARVSSRSWAYAVAQPMARRSEFEGRLLAILEPGVKRHGVTPAATLGIVLSVLVTALPLAAMGPEGPAAAIADRAVGTLDEDRGVSHALRVDALLGAMDDADRDVRVTVVAALGGLQDTAAVQALMRALRSDTDAEVRAAAAYALGEIEDPRAIPALGQALQSDDDLNVRVVAAHALGEIEDSRGVPSLAAAINDSERDVRLAAIRALGEIESPDAIDALATVTRDGDTEIRMMAVWALGEIEDARAVPAISQVLTSDSDAAVREKAAWALGEIEHGSAVDALAQALNDDDVKVRRMAVWALGEIEDARAVDPLVSVLNDPDPEIRLLAIRALGEIESRAAVDPLIAILGDPDAKVREAAIWALGEIEDPRAAPAIAQRLTDSSVAVRRRTAAALGDLDLGTAPPQLIEALNDEDLDVVRQAIRALGDIEDPAAVPGLAQLFRNPDTDGETRRAVVWALGEIEDPASYQVLVEALEDDDPEIRKYAARALGGRD